MADLVYNSAFTGEQIDSAVAAVAAKEAVWDAKADASADFTAVLSASGWTDAAPYTQSVMVDGMTDSSPLTDVVLSDDAETAISESDEWQKVDKIQTADGVITATCLRYIPTMDLNVQMKVIK